MKNIRNQAPKWATHYDDKSDTYNDKGVGFGLAKLSAMVEFLICLTLLSVAIITTINL